MHDILVSVVIPTYMRPDRICRAVDSALNQTIKSLEVIVVDDNGKDTEEAIQTAKALETYINENKIQYIQNVINSGGSFSRNVGLNVAKGKYITFLDDDDEIAPTKLEKQVQCLEEKGESYGACYTGYHKLLENGNIIYSDEKIEGNVYPYALARSIYVGSGSNLLVRTDVARKIGGYDTSFKRNQDLEFLARITKDYALAYVDEDLMTIHYEIREVKRSYENLVAIDDYFLNQFKEEINQLPKEDQKKVLDTFALERWRYSLTRGAFLDGHQNLNQQHVSLLKRMKYIGYLIDRVIRKKSYGFKQ